MLISGKNAEEYLSSVEMTKTQEVIILCNKKSIKQ